MNALAYIYDFLVSTWLFSITYDWFHLCINPIVLGFFLKKPLSKRRRSCLSISVMAHFCVWLFFTFSMIGLITCNIAYQWIATDITESLATNNLLLACFYVGLVYTILLSIFFYLRYIRSKVFLPDLFWAIAFANGITVFLSYLIIYFIISPLL